MTEDRKPSLWLLGLAYAAVYIIWGSTYFFIEKAVHHVAPAFLGGLRFVAAALIMFLFVKKDSAFWSWRVIAPAIVSGLLMSFLGNGAVIFAEQSLPSSFVAIFCASAPLWFLIMDSSKWRENFTNKYTLLGVFVGMLGVIFLFYEKLIGAGAITQFWPLVVLIIGNLGWAAGSLYTQKHGGKNPTVNAIWQMLAAGVAFFMMGIFNSKLVAVQWDTVPVDAWLAIAYLIVFGSIIGYSSYVFLLKHQSATQVSTYAYVNPLVAVLLGVFLSKDVLTTLQITGLVIILCSVFFINLAKKERIKKAARSAATPD